MLRSFLYSFCERAVGRVRARWQEGTMRAIQQTALPAPMYPVTFGSSGQAASRLAVTPQPSPRSLFQGNSASPVKAHAGLSVAAPAEVLLRNLRLARPGAPPQLSAAHARLQLLVIDEDEPVRRAICEIATNMGFGVHAASGSTAATDLLTRHSLDLILMDLRVRDGGLALLERMRKSVPRVPVVVMTAFATVQSAVEALRLGAADYLTKPFAMEELTTTLEQAAEQRNFDLESRRLQEVLRGDAVAHGICGESAAMQKLLRMASKVASANHPVLITGESGSGKETLARSIHRVARAAEPFNLLECATVSPVLLESELFGYVRHENTAGRDERRGLLTAEEGGTLLLDEISAIPLDLQAKLLRALQDRCVRPAGGAAELPITVRVLATSARDLSALVDAGSFRRDLYLRLAVVHLRMPSLRERLEDVPLLSLHFLKRHSEQRGVNFRVTEGALRMLCGYDWPGNVRELEVMMERACSVASGPALDVADLPTQIQQKLRADIAQSSTFDARNVAAPGIAPHLSAQIDPIQTIADVERETILSTLEKLNGDKLMAARLLGIGKTTLYRKLKEYDIEDVPPGR